MNKYIEEKKAAFYTGHIEEVVSPSDFHGKRSQEHKNRLVISPAQKSPMPSAMQNYNNNI